MGYIATFGNLNEGVSCLTTNGTWTALAFNATSDREAKENFQPVDACVLDRVANMPMTCSRPLYWLPRRARSSGRT